MILAHWYFLTKLVHKNNWFANMFLHSLCISQTDKCNILKFLDRHCFWGKRFTDVWAFIWHWLDVHLRVIWDLWNSLHESVDFWDILSARCNLFVSAKTYLLTSYFYLWTNYFVRKKNNCESLLICMRFILCMQWFMRQEYPVLEGISWGLPCSLLHCKESQLQFC